MRSSIYLRAKNGIIPATPVAAATIFCRRPSLGPSGMNAGAYRAVKLQKVPACKLHPFYRETLRCERLFRLIVASFRNQKRIATDNYKRSAT
jgi:hypothetical protein